MFFVSSLLSHWALSHIFSRLCSLVSRVATLPTGSCPPLCVSSFLVGWFAFCTAGTQPLGSRHFCASLAGSRRMLVLPGCSSPLPFALLSFWVFSRFTTRRYTSWGPQGSYVTPRCVIPPSRLRLLGRLAHRAPCVGVSQVPVTAPANLADPTDRP